MAQRIIFLDFSPNYHIKYFTQKQISMFIMIPVCLWQGIQMCTKKKLCNIKGISEAKVDKIKEVAVKVSGVIYFEIMFLAASDTVKVICPEPTIDI